jgi:hypothetical protein
MGAESDVVVGSDPKKILKPIDRIHTIYRIEQKA